MKKDVYQIITDRIIKLLESEPFPGTGRGKGERDAPKLREPESIPRNQFVLLKAAGFTSPYWLSFKQAQDLDANVKKGEKSFPVIFWKCLRRRKTAR